MSLTAPLVFSLTVTDSAGLPASDSESVSVTVQMLDADGDGISNLDEYLQGSNPLDGDVNADGVLNIVDLLLAQRHVLGYAQLNPDQEARLDLAPLPGGADGVVNLGDVVVLQRRVLAAH